MFQWKKPHLADLHLKTTSTKCFVTNSEFNRKFLLLNLFCSILFHQEQLWPTLNRMLNLLLDARPADGAHCATQTLFCIILLTPPKSLPPSESRFITKMSNLTCSSLLAPLIRPLIICLSGYLNWAKTWPLCWATLLSVMVLCETQKCLSPVNHRGWDWFFAETCWLTHTNITRKVSHPAVITLINRLFHQGNITFFVYLFLHFVRSSVSNAVAVLENIIYVGETGGSSDATLSICFWFW